MSKEPRFDFNMRWIFPFFKVLIRFEFGIFETKRQDLSRCDISIHLTYDNRFG